MAGTLNCAGDSEVKAHKESETHEYLVVRVTGQVCAVAWKSQRAASQT